MSGGRPRRRPARLCSLVGSRLRSQALFRLAARAAASSSPRRSKPPDPSARNLRRRLRRRMRRSCRGSAAFSSRSRPRELRYASRVAPQFDRLVRKPCDYEIFRCQIVVSSEAVDAGATAIRAPARIYVVLGHWRLSVAVRGNRASPLVDCFLHEAASGDCFETLNTSGVSDQLRFARLPN